MSGFEIRIEEDGRIVVRGEVDLATAPQLASAIESLARTDEPRVVVDLAGVSFLDSTGLAALIMGRDKLEAQDGALVLGPVSPRVQSMLEMAGLDGAFVQEASGA